jgi:hypothetical protein
MSELINSILQSIVPIVIGAILTHVLKRKTQEMSSEDIEEISKPDGSKTKKHKKRYK